MGVTGGMEEYRRGREGGGGGVETAAAGPKKVTGLPHTPQRGVMAGLRCWLLGYTGRPALRVWGGCSRVRRGTGRASSWFSFGAESAEGR